MESPVKERSRRIDVLRGIAIFGILLVNVWSFVSGGNFRFGDLGPGAPWLDQAAVFAVAAFAEFKFYPLFAFLFGAGFMLQTDRLRAGPGGLFEAKRIYRRRLGWLLGLGVLHGALLFSDEILTAYALIGFWLMLSAGRRTGELVKTLKVVAIIAAVICLMLLVGGLLSQPDTQEVASRKLADAVRESALYANGSWQEIAWMRLKSYAIHVPMILFVAPHIAACFLLGAVATRLGWFTRPERFRDGWRRVRLIGLVVGLPLNLWIGWIMLQHALHPLQGGKLENMAFALLMVAGPVLTAAYVAHIMLFGPQRILRWAKWLAPVGRMALTNYVAQSLLLGLLLQGTGLGLARHLSPAGLIGLCFAIMAAQLIWSRRWLARHRHGPLETLWRRHTYK